MVNFNYAITLKKGWDELFTICYYHDAEVASFALT